MFSAERNTDADVLTLIAELKRRREVVATDTKVTYKLG